MNAPASSEYFDVIIIGAGLSGIGAAHHLIHNCPSKSYTILEGRERMGGTWDLFQYPGIRSDSDMYTLGYTFKPWKAAEAIADGPQILNYINETAKERKIDQHIKYQHWVQNINWNSKEDEWTITSTNKENGTQVVHRCNFIINCTGYYNYEEGYTPDYKNLDQYQGKFVHPQKWEKDINYENKKVIVIGSGATAVTLVPELAKKAKKVYMLQRSPSYIITAPEQDKIANFFKKILPSTTAHKINKWKNVLLSLGFYKLCKRFPSFAKKLITSGVKKELGASHFEKKHFDPNYNPWDQRLCMVPDSDLFKSIKAEKSIMVTDEIEHFTTTGVKLKSGENLEADLVVSATGLKLIFIGGIQMSIDDKEIDPATLIMYRGTMLSGVPNFAAILGYTNASWTLKSDLSSQYACRIINHLDKIGKKSCTPTVLDNTINREPAIDFNSGYVTRSIAFFPKQGSKAPWRLLQNYPRDLFNFKYSSLKDKSLKYA